MGSSSKPPQPPPTPPPVTVTGPERARAEDDARRTEKKRWDWQKTIVGGLGTPNLPTGMKDTLG